MNGAAALEGKTVLLVEDESLVSMLAEEILMEAGCEVILAMRLDRALEVARSAEIDCALLDVNLGNGATSFPVAQVLSERGVPFIFVSGYGTHGIDGAYANAPVVQKPYRPDLLLSALEACLAD
ncbi:response regulator [Altererythrobacter soli]|uniref:Response regulator n=2 Tax=Croceibacterium soli TaxID=1739690 RepID=A0A6I4UTR7_9SPHN|nr:response regulator [Croceibacterium soli]